MDLQQQTAPALSRKEIKLKRRLEKVLRTEELDLQRELVKKISTELNVGILDCAAALVSLSQPNFYHAERQHGVADIMQATPQKRLRKMPPPKMIRYRFEVGKKHNVSVEEIKHLVIREAGVDRNMIGEVTIYQHNTFIELPEGMPADIFQLLTTTTLRGQALKIKRMRFNRKRNKSQ